MKTLFAFALLCFTLSSPPAFSQITEEEILALMAENDLLLARERVQQARREAPTSAMLAYYSALLEEDADAAASSFLDFNKRFGDSAYGDDALYRLGQYYFARGNYSRSRQYFGELMSKPAGSPLAPAAQYLAAKTLLLSGDLFGAKGELEIIARQFPNTWMAKLAQEDLQSEALKNLPANTAPPRAEEKSAASKTETPAAPKKAEPSVAPAVSASTKKEEPKAAPPTIASRKEEPQVERKSESKPAAKKTEPKPKATALYAVQVGAYLQRVNAEDQKKRYAQAGYKTEVVEKQEGRRKYFAVWVGELNTRDQAYALVEELKKKFKVRAHTVRRDE